MELDRVRRLGLGGMREFGCVAHKVPGDLFRLRLRHRRNGGVASLSVHQSSKGRIGRPPMLAVSGSWFGGRPELTR